MSLTSDQLATLAAHIRANTNPAVVQALANGADNAIASLYNLPAAPAFYVKRTTLSRHEILTGTSDDGTTFAWAGGAYITRSQGERDAFREMFNSTGTVNPSLPSITAAFNDIFSGAGGAGNRTHIVAMSRRTANVVEKALVVSGLGTKADPAVAGFEGSITADDVAAALRP